MYSFGRRYCSINQCQCMSVSVSQFLMNALLDLHTSCSTACINHLC